MEHTFAIIKPRAVADKHVGDIVGMIEKAGFDILALDLIVMAPEEAEELYAEHKEKSFFGEMVESMTSAPVVVMKLQRENAVAAWRELMGATNPANAAAGTVRALYGHGIGDNAVHGSDSNASASRELAIFFEDCGC